MVSDNTKEKIIQAAQKVFIRKGMDGARMQEIADEAGINKALLHYYFRSKQQLFDEIFYEVFGKLIPGLMGIFRQEGSILEKIEPVVNTYITFLSKNPFLPQFMIREINRDPDHLFQFMQGAGFDTQYIEAMIQEEVNQGKIRPITFAHFFANLAGMVVFPYVARPLLQRNFFKNDPVRYELFLQERRIVVVQFIKHALTG